MSMANKTKTTSGGIPRNVVTHAVFGLSFCFVISCPTITFRVGRAVLQSSRLKSFVLLFVGNLRAHEADAGASTSDCECVISVAAQCSGVDEGSTQEVKEAQREAAVADTSEEEEKHAQGRLRLPPEGESSHTCAQTAPKVILHTFLLRRCIVFNGRAQNQDDADIPSPP